MGPINTGYGTGIGTGTNSLFLNTFSLKFGAEYGIDKLFLCGVADISILVADSTSLKLLNFGEQLVDETESDLESSCTFENEHTFPRDGLFLNNPDNASV